MTLDPEGGGRVDRAQYQLPDDAFVCCCFNNNFKFQPEVFRSWMRTLQAVPGSVLWLLADLFLDTWPCNAGATANDVLWRGSPVLTLSGRTYISRMAGSLLTQVGLPDLITENLTDYDKLAITLGGNPARVVSYKCYLREEGRRSVLCDMPRFARDLEAALQRTLLTQAQAA